LGYGSYLYRWTKNKEKGAFHNDVKVPRKLKISADYAAVLSHT
jgi:hypothetical protein